MCKACYCATFNSRGAVKFNLHVNVCGTFRFKRYIFFFDALNKVYIYCMLIWLILPSNSGSFGGRWRLQIKCLHLFVFATTQNLMAGHIIMFFQYLKKYYLHFAIINIFCSSLHSISVLWFSLHVCFVYSLLVYDLHVSVYLTCLSSATVALLLLSFTMHLSLSHRPQPGTPTLLSVYFTKLCSPFSLQFIINVFSLKTARVRKILMIWL